MNITKQRSSSAAKLKLVVVRRAQASRLAGVRRVIAALPQRAGQSEMDVFIEEKPQLHAARNDTLPLAA